MSDEVIKILAKSLKYTCQASYGQQSETLPQKNSFKDFYKDFAKIFMKTHKTLDRIALID